MYTAGEAKRSVSNLQGKPVRGPLTVRQRVNLLRLGLVPVDPTQTRQRIHAINVHRARATDALPARTPERQRRIQVILDLDERIQHHRSAFRQVDLVRLQRRLFRRRVRVPAVDFELLEFLAGSGRGRRRGGVVAGRGGADRAGGRQGLGGCQEAGRGRTCGKHHERGVVCVVAQWADDDEMTLAGR